MCRSIAAVTFDLWGTLLDGRYSLWPRRCEMLARYLPSHTSKCVEEAYGESWRRFSQATDGGFGMRGVTVLSMTLDRLGATLSPPTYKAVLQGWEEATLQEPPPFLEGVPDMLYRLRDKGLLIGLISDTGVTPGWVLRRLLRERGLLKAFDWLTFSDEIGVTKVCAYPFTSTLRVLRVPAESALHVGDLPEIDLRGARSAGMHSALVLESSARRDGIAEAEIVLERICDLPKALSAWEACA
ncbi:MAG: HAD family hydrolase [Anaerolineales bacterium]